MPIYIVRNDITKMNCDAIVNAANSSLLGGGGVDGAIHRAAGEELLEECRTLGGCNTGQAKITKGYNLPCKYIIHTVGPIWQGGDNGERELLTSCYRESLKLAAEYKCESVAFPLISTGVYGYPKDLGIQAAVDEISRFLLDHDMAVYLTVFDKSGFQISQKLFSDITQYIDENYVEEHFISDRKRSELHRCAAACPNPAKADTANKKPKNKQRENRLLSFNRDEKERENWDTASDMQLLSPPPSLEEMVNAVDESFSQMLLRKIDEKGMTDSQCYKRANIDRRLFAKIRKDVNYKPSKPTAIAFAIALKLSLEETKEMLMKAGYALSHSSKFDIIIEYFITNGKYDIIEINEALFAFDQVLLGA